MHVYEQSKQTTAQEKKKTHDKRPKQAHQEIHNNNTNTCMLMDRANKTTQENKNIRNKRPKTHTKKYANTRTNTCMYMNRANKEQHRKT